ncbi:MAG: hypothetical protein GX129_09340 [Clostridiales bacterium]|jgi:fluoroquinolone transport system permease protein|nr:hypothetical protein [Clostridiales bacterium]
MGRYLFLLRFEAKNIFRDSINIYMCVFPLVILMLASFVFPRILDRMEGIGLEITMMIMLIIILIFGSFFLAAMATFLLLDNKDDNTLNTVAVTPIGTSGYIIFKMTYIYIMTVISTIIILWGTKLIAGDRYSIGGVSLFDRLNLFQIIVFAFAAGLFTPAMALFQSAMAKNKIEGFALIKGSGMIAMVPALMIMNTFEGGMQYVLGIFPNFWAVKGLMMELIPNNNSANLSFFVYIFIGAVYNILILVVTYRLFLKKVKY